MTVSYFHPSIAGELAMPTRSDPSVAGQAPKMSYVPPPPLPADLPPSLQPPPPEGYSTRSFVDWG